MDIVKKHFGIELPPSYLKIIYMRTYLQYNEWILWIDTDAVIKNTEFDIESIVKPNKYIYLSKDINGINSGVMLIRKSQATIDFLNKVWSIREEFVNHKWWEQGAIMKLYEENAFRLNEITEFVPQHIFNAYEYSRYSLEYKEGEICDNTFIAHFPALPFDTRLELIKKYGSNS